MARKTTRTLISVRVNSMLLQRLDALADLCGRNRSELIDRAIEDYLSRHDPTPLPKPAKPRKP